MNKRQKRGCILAAVGLCMVLLAAAMQFMQENRDRLAGENAQILLRELTLSRTVLSAPDTQTQTDMPEKEYLGYAMIGCLRIGSVGLELPVLSQWSYELLDVAPCRYSGSIAGGDLILLGHNYQSHFAPQMEVCEGDSVEFEDVNGVCCRYTVAAVEILRGWEGEKLPSGYPLSIFTCTPGGQSRLVLRCEAAEE